MSRKEEQERRVLKRVEIAEKHKTSSVAHMELFCLERACKGLIRISVEEFHSADEAIEYLNEQKLPEYLVRFIELNKKIYASFKVKPMHPETELSNNIDIVHFAWLMEMNDLAKDMLLISTDEAVWKHYSPHRLMKDYHRMVAAFVSGKTYKPNPPKLKGYEKHWLPYIQLMEAFTRQENTSAAIAAVDESFTKRNRDKRLMNHPSFDGDGNAPVNWDLRKHTILEIGSRLYGSG